MFEIEERLSMYLQNNAKSGLGGKMRLARPRKWRRVEFIPETHYFVPVDIEAEHVDQNILRIEEAEAIRLKDLEGLGQEECAKSMEVSRQTFQRILNSARQKIADAIINGKAIRIEGGNFTLNICAVRCLQCGREWKESYENLEKLINGDYACPSCESKNIVCLRPGKRQFCRGNCWRRGRMR